MNIQTRSGIKWAVLLPTDRREEILEWCRQTFGEPNMIGGRWFPLEYTIQFSDQKDRNWYRMRWLS